MSYMYDLRCVMCFSCTQCYTVSVEKSSRKKQDLGWVLTSCWTYAARYSSKLNPG